MRHFHLILISAFFISTSLFSQFPTYKFANGIGSAANEEGHAVTIDGSGTSYITGRFTGLADFDPTVATATLIPVGSADIYVASYKGNGQYQWAFNIGGTNADEGNDIALSPSGDVYVVGSFGGVADFDPSPATATLSSPGFGSNMFLAKYSSTGIYQWAISIGLSANEVAKSVCVDATGNVLVTGSFEGTVDFNPGAGVFNLTSNGGTDVFIAKYSSTGNFINAVGFGSATNDIGNSICTDAASNIYLCGNFTSTIDLDPGLSTVNFTSAGQEDIFTSKFTSGLSFSWGFGTGSSQTDNCLTIGFDNGCNSVYIGGDFFNTVDFNPGPSTNNLTSSGSLDAYVANYDLNGNYLSAFKVGVSTGAESVTDIYLDNNCYFYITGGFSGLNTDFDPGVGTTTLSTLGSTDIFVAKYKAGNSLQWAFSVGDFNNDYGFGIAANTTGDLSVTGQFFGNACDFNPYLPTANLANIGGTDIFIASYDVVTITSIESNSIKDQGTGLILQNQSNTIAIQSDDIYQLNVMDLTGKIIDQREVSFGLNSIDINHLANGLYFFTFTNSTKSVAKKIIKQ